MDAAAIQALLNAQAGTGGYVVLPNGRHTLQALSGSRSLDIPSNVTLKGESEDGCILEVDAGAEAHALNAIDTVSSGVEDLTVEGNGSAQSTNVHLIRGDNTQRFTIKRVTLRNSKGYSIGLQEGTFTDTVIDTVLIEDSGNDGIDTKNKNDDNARNVMRNVTVNRYNLLSGVDDKAGIDLRGPWSVYDPIITGVPHDCVGIRCRQGELGDVNGLGGHNSAIYRPQVTGTSAANSWGVQAIARDVSVYNGVFTDLAVGGITQELRALYHTCQAVDCTEAGFRATTSGSPYFGTDGIFRYCSSTGAPIGIHAAQNNTKIEQYQGTDNITFVAGTTGCIAVGPSATIVNPSSVGVVYVGSDDDLIDELTAAGFQPLSAQLGADNSQRILATVRFAHREGTGTMYYEIANSALLSTLAAPMAAAYNALR